MTRRIGTALSAVLLLILCSPAIAQAHGGASVTIHSDGRGSVWITAQWQDGHPINEPTPVTLTATGDGSASVAPATLRQTGDERGTQTYTGTLAPGAWRVAITLGPPVDGRCQALVQVAAAEAASPPPTEVACLIPASSPAPEAPQSAGSLTPLWITLAALAVAAGVTVVTLRRRRRV